eukprot:2236072-Karenia_brevis.AAC.1
MHHCGLKANGHDSRDAKRHAEAYHMAHLQAHSILFAGTVAQKKSGHLGFGEARGTCKSSRGIAAP